MNKNYKILLLLTILSLIGFNIGCIVSNPIITATHTREKKPSQTPPEINTIGASMPKYTDGPTLTPEPIKSFVPPIVSTPTPPADRFIAYNTQDWKTYKSLDGLPKGYVQTIEITVDGIMWFGTSSGLSRFDGHTWTTYTITDGLADNVVYSIAVAVDGVIYVGTRAGVSRFDGKSWITYSTGDGLPDQIIQTVEVDRDGFVWVGTQHMGVSRYDGKKWTNFTDGPFGSCSNNIYEIVAVPEGGVWIGSGGGLVYTDGKNLKDYDIVVHPGASCPSVRRIARSIDGSLWLITADSGIVNFKDGMLVRYTVNDGLGSDTAQALAVAPNGTVWIGIGNGSVSSFDGKEWTLYYELPFRVVWDIAIESNGAVWFGTENGVYKYTPSK